MKIWLMCCWIYVKNKNMIKMKFCDLIAVIDEASCSLKKTKNKWKQIFNRIQLTNLHPHTPLPRSAGSSTPLLHLFTWLLFVVVIMEYNIVWIMFVFFTLQILASVVPVLIVESWLPQFLTPLFKYGKCSPKSSSYGGGGLLHKLGEITQVPKR